jgi:hypothetical protein
MWQAERMPSLLLPAIGLFLLAPLVAEFLLGNLPITALYTLIVLAPLYGGGALLIREIARRRSLGWPSILVLALAYGVLEEGITTMSLFNPNYANQRLLDYGYVAWLGLGIPWTLFVLGLHAVWSISVPIAVVEVLAGARGLSAWLGRISLPVVAVLFAFGVVASTAISISTYAFVASAWQLVSIVVIVGVLIWLALAVVPRLPTITPAEGSHAPPPLLLAAASLLVTSVFKQLPHSLPAWAYVVVVVLGGIGAIVAVWRLAHQSEWTAAHRLALASGALLTYAWTAFPEEPVLPASPPEDLVGNCVFAVGAVILIGAAAWRLHAPSGAPSTRASDATRMRPGQLGQHS